MYRVFALAALAFAALPGSARAETTLCKSIDALPAVITAQGSYCLASDLATGIKSGNAITIAANNVTLDCNGFKLGGLAAGAGTQAVGIGAMNRSNVTVRNCHVRGFLVGIGLDVDETLPAPPRGHLVESNRLDGNRRRGISVAGDGSVVRGNLVSETGASTLPVTGIGIVVQYGTDVIDNLVTGVRPSQTGGASTGIHVGSGAGNTIARNRVRDVTGTQSRAFYLAAPGRATFVDNSASASRVDGALGIVCAGGSTGVLMGNALIGYSDPIGTCGLAGRNNTISP